MTSFIPPPCLEPDFRIAKSVPTEPKGCGGVARGFWSPAA